MIDPFIDSNVRLMFSSEIKLEIRVGRSSSFLHFFRRFFFVLEFYFFRKSMKKVFLKQTCTSYDCLLQEEGL